MSRRAYPRWLFSPALWIVALIALYLVSRFSNLLALPVFADEAIYIRWAQLLRHDRAYLYFSVNDGKPPLFMWILGTILALPANPLWLGRAVSATVGLVQLFALDRIIRQLGGQEKARLASAVMVITAPFWFFHHRMALMDGLVTLFLTFAVWGVLRLRERTTRSSSLFQRVVSLAIAGTAWGLALWTKTPALFLAPFFVVVAWWDAFWKTLSSRKFVPQDWMQPTLWIAGAGALGLGIFLIMRLQPMFGSLFSRSSDFTFTLQEFFSGSWRTSIDNGGRFLEWIGANLRPEMVSIAAFAALVSRKRKTHWLLWLGALIFAAPLILLGKTLHPRYFLPVSLFITTSAALMFEEAFTMIPKGKKNDLPWGQILLSLVVGMYLIGSLRFLLLSIFTPNQTPFVLADRSQYLTEWSSGHGIREVRDKLIERAHAGQRTTVVTEGSFGTLPDGLLLEFDARPEIEYLRIQGLEQYPVKYLPDWVFEEAAQHETWLLVNENRLEMPLDEIELIARYPRPYGAPELQVYRVKPR